jgi:alpha-tubulin suppressor-like RCC1 family protein
MRQDDDDATIRDVALGGDHTLVLSSNQRDVYAFGKGGEGQLGTTGKPFVSAPVKATKLSVSSNDNKTKIAAVCAIQHCALTIDDKGDVLKHAGKCRRSSREFQEALEACIRRATSNGLLSSR